MKQGRRHEFFRDTVPKECNKTPAPQKTRAVQKRRNPANIWRRFIPNRREGHKRKSGASSVAVESKSVK
jgi:hypothetical protein